MKIYKIFTIVVLFLLGMSVTSCDDFLNRPAEDTYTTDDYYTTADECFSGVNYLYNLPWCDIQQPWFVALEYAAGNLASDTDPFAQLTVSSDNDAIKQIYNSLFAANLNCNVVINNIMGGTAPYDAKMTTSGEALVLKAYAYFSLVRHFGALPLVHDNIQDMGTGAYADCYRVDAADVYEYIVMTLEEALKRLPKQNQKGRIDYYSAEGLLAKVYLTRSGYGQNGSRNENDLKKAAALAKDVIDNSGRKLMENYEDIFRGHNNFSDEALISLHYYGSWHPYGAGNQLQSQFSHSGFSSYNTWGDWVSPSIDLMEAFGVKPTDNPETRADADIRRKASMMMAGDKYSYFWREVGGFDYLRFLFDKDYNPTAAEEVRSGTGANCVKHLVGSSQDHNEEMGYPDGNSAATGLSTHLLRLADVYLIYTEAMIGNNGSTSDPSAIDAFYAVRSRSVRAAQRPSSVSFDDVWKERRLELAFEGDRWFDFVRLSYYDPQRAITEISNSKRSGFNGLNDLYKNYYNGHGWNVSETMKYNPNAPKLQPSTNVFTFPYPEADLSANPNLLKDPIRVDVRSTYSY